jgi:hypothetical protein
MLVDLCFSERIHINRSKSRYIATAVDSDETLNAISCFEDIRKCSVTSKAALDELTLDEIFTLTSECFPRIDECRVVIFEYSQNSLRESEFTLEEVLSSEHILQPGDLVDRVRWIYVEYYKIGCFWGSDLRFS